jgi:hypothetical protein
VKIALLLTATMACASLAGGFAALGFWILFAAAGAAALCLMAATFDAVDADKVTAVMDARVRAFIGGDHG